MALAVHVLLALGVAGALLCVVGVAVMRTAYERLHYAAAASTVPAFLILAAVLLREHASSGGLEAIAAVGLLFLLNPILLAATTRAIRESEEDEA